MILTFVIIFIVASIWDVRRVNRRLEDVVNPGQRPTFYR
jgi:hypothetical protein